MSSNCIVSSGQVSSGIELYDNDRMIVLNGGIASDTTVNEDGQLYISSGGVANFTTVNEDGQLYISSGGVANSTTVNDWGYINVSSGGTANTTTVYWGGHIYVSSGGTACDTTLAPRGYLIVSSGGTANNTTVYAWANLGVSDGAAIDTAAIGDCGYLYLRSGASATNVTADSGARLYLDVAPNTYIQGTSGGSAFTMQNGCLSGFILNSNNVVYVSSGGTADAIIINGGSLDVYNGGTASDTTVNNGGYLYLGSGASATNVTADSGARLYLEVASNTYIQGTSGGSAFTMQNGCLSGFSLNDGGFLSVSSGCAVNSITVHSGGLQVEREAVATSVVIGNSCSMYVEGSADNTIISGGSVFVYSGGTATNIDWTPCVGSIYVEEGAYVTYKNQYSGVYYGSGGQLLSHADVLSGTFLGGISASMYVMNGGTASDTTISGGGMFVSSGGIVNAASVMDGGMIEVSCGGIVNSASISDGSMFVSSGGIADSASVNGGTLFVFSGGSATNVDWTPCEGIVVAENRDCISFASQPSGVYYGSDNQLLSSSAAMAGVTLDSGSVMCVMQGGTADSTIVNSNGSLFVYDSGCINSATVNSGGYLGILYGASANAATINNGSLVVYGLDAVMSDTTINDNGYAYIHAGALYSTTLNDNGYLLINSGCSADTVTLNRGGTLWVFSGGSATNIAWTPCEGIVKMQNSDNVSFTSQYSGVYYGSDNQLLSNSAEMTGVTLDSGSVMCVMKDGCVRSATINDDGSMYVYSGGTACNTALNEGSIFVVDGTVNTVTASDGNINVQNGGRVISAVISDRGYLDVYNGGAACNTKVEKNSYLWLSGGAAHSGTLQIASGATVSAYSGATIDFTAAQQTAGGVALINDWSRISGGNDANYTLTVKADQANGTYQLAAGAADFNKTVTVKNTSGTQLGTLSVGNTLKSGNSSYTLTKNNDLLTLSVETVVTPDPVTPDPVTPDPVTPDPVSPQPAVVDKKSPVLKSVSGSQKKGTYLVNLKVKASDNVGVTGYALTYVNPKTKKKVSLNLTGTTFTVAENCVGTLKCTLKAVDAAGNKSSAKSFTVKIKDYTAPAWKSSAKSSVSAVTRQKGGTLKWSGATDNVKVTKYTVKVLNSSGKTVKSYSTASSSVKLSGIKAGVNFSYKITAKDAAGNTGKTALTGQFGVGDVSNNTYKTASKLKKNKSIAAVLNSADKLDFYSFSGASSLDLEIDTGSVKATLLNAKGKKVGSVITLQQGSTYNWDLASYGTARYLKLESKNAQYLLASKA